MAVKFTAGLLRAVSIPIFVGSALFALGANVGRALDTPFQMSGED